MMSLHDIKPLSRMQSLAVKMECARQILALPPVALAIGLLLVMVLASLASSELRMAFPQDPFDPGRVLVAIGQAGCFVLAYWVLVRFVERKPLRDFSTEGWARELSAGLVGAFLLFSAIVAVAAALGVYHVAGTNSWETIWPMLARAIVSGVTEEILFRAVLFRLLERMVGSWIALAVSAALFGMVHFDNDGGSWFAALAIAVEAGILLSAVYMLTRRLWAAIGVHAGWNFTQGWVFGVPISGNEATGILDGRLTGPVWLSGGEFGLEGSVIALAIATAAGVWVLALAIRRGNVVAPMWARKIGDISRDTD